MSIQQAAIRLVRKGTAPDLDSHSGKNGDRRRQGVVDIYFDSDGQRYFSLKGKKLILGDREYNSYGDLFGSDEYFVSQMLRGVVLGTAEVVRANYEGNEGFYSKEIDLKRISRKLKKNEVLIDRLIFSLVFYDIDHIMPSRRGKKDGRNMVTNRTWLQRLFRLSSYQVGYFDFEASFPSQILREFLGTDPSCKEKSWANGDWSRSLLYWASIRAARRRFWNRKNILQDPLFQDKLVELQRRFNSGYFDAVVDGLPGLEKKAYHLPEGKTARDLVREAYLGTVNNILSLSTESIDDLRRGMKRDKAQQLSQEDARINLERGRTFPFMLAKNYYYTLG